MSFKSPRTKSHQDKHVESTQIVKLSEKETNGHCKRLFDRELCPCQNAATSPFVKYVNLYVSRYLKLVRSDS